MIFPAAVWP